MAQEIFLQHWIFTQFALPFLLIFAIVFGVLEVTKIFGKEKKQLNAVVAFVIGLIFISFVYPKMVVENLVLFMTVAIIVVFITLLLWGFVIGGDAKLSEDTKWLKWVAGIGIIIVVGVAVLWAMGIYDEATSFLFDRDWSGEFWTNVVFIVVIVIAMALILRTKAKKD